MDPLRRKAIQDICAQFTTPNEFLSWSMVLADFLIYGMSVCTSVVAISFTVKVTAVLGAGLAISMLFILGHDAAHRNLMKSGRVNQILARILFLPCLHNFSLWQMEHNWTHHQHTNVKGRNSFSPMSFEDYSTSPIWRRALEHLYRNPLGFGAYYLVERWWKHKLYPFRPRPMTNVQRAKRDFLLLVLWVVALCFFVLFVDANLGSGGSLLAILWGVVLPFLVWNQLMGTTAFLQHTHPNAQWTDSVRHSADIGSGIGGLEVTINVRFPRWYDLLSHNIMQHGAHHVNARIPWFRLRRAQDALARLAGDDIISERIGPRYLLRTIKACQLYDYKSNTWLNFNGRTTAYPRVAKRGLPPLPQH
jgi:omega-6 fatty acid desaturase (delta-12 desaturase)